MSHFTIIVAATKSNGIGQSGKLPWKLSKEMAYFARVTSSAPDGRMNAVIMGRKTWESIPAKFKPLSKRFNVVVSRNGDYELTPSSSLAPVHLCSNLASAVELTSQADIHRRFVIGGVSLFTEALNSTSSNPMSPVADRVLLTRIVEPDFPQCDVHMPEFVEADEGEKDAWRQASHDELMKWTGFEVPGGIQEENGVKYEFQMWVRR